MLKVLIVDDEKHNCDALQETLSRLQCETETASNGREALESINTKNYDLVLTDVRMPVMDGIELFETVRHAMGHMPTVPAFAFMTAYGRIDEAVACLKKGATHFLTKPLRRKDLLALVSEINTTRQRQISLRQTQNQRKSQASHMDVNELVYCSRAMGEVVDLVDRIAATPISVLILGESGVGKELIAQRIHQKSQRYKGPFVALNAAALPENLVESELFGYVKGSFTGADRDHQGQIRTAHGGTFFIDEVLSMPMGLQAKWLRVIQDNVVWPVGAVAPVQCDVRWVAAANEDPQALVASGRFREDLLYRLQVVTVVVPPLRDRVEDIPLLIEKFLSELYARDERVLELDAELQATLLAYSWPGNVRELRNVIERLAALAQDGKATLEHLPTHMAHAQSIHEIRLSLGVTLQDAQDKLIDETLKLCNGDKVRAAQILGINARTIYRWLETKSTQ